MANTRPNATTNRFEDNEHIFCLRLDIARLHLEEGYEVKDKDNNILFTISCLDSENNDNPHTNNKFGSKHFLNTESEVYKRCKKYSDLYMSERGLSNEPEIFPYFDDWLENYPDEESIIVLADLRLELEKRRKRITCFRLSFPNGYQILLPYFFTFDTREIRQKIEHPDFNSIKSLFHEACPYDFEVSVTVQDEGSLIVKSPTEIFYDVTDITGDTYQSKTFYQPKEGRDGNFTLQTEDLEIVAATRMALGKGKYGVMNEDSFGVSLEDDGSVLIAVADGLGGHIRGEVASNNAVRGALVTPGDIQQKYEAGHNRVNFLSLYFLLNDPDFKSLPESTLLILKIRQSIITAVYDGDTQYSIFEEIGEKGENGEIIAGSKIGYDSIESLTLRNIIRFNTQYETFAGLNENMTIVAYTDGLISDIVEREVWHAIKGKSLKDGLLSLLKKVSDINKGGKRTWCTPQGDDFTFTASQDNVTTLLVRKREVEPKKKSASNAGTKKEVVASKPGRWQTFWKKLKNILS